MRAVDPRLLRAAPAVRRFLGACGLLAAVTAATVIVQATLIGDVVARVFLGHRDLAAVAGPLLLLAAAALARGLWAWAFEAGGHLTAAVTTRELRRQLVRGVLDSGAEGRSSAAITTATIDGVDALDPYFARYLPQLALAAVVPAAILVWVAVIDAESAVIMAATLPLIPLFGILVGRETGRRARARHAALTQLGGHFLSVVRGLPTLRAFNRGAAQAGRIAETSEAYRRETMATLRVAFLSAFVLELAAMLGIAVVAVEIGIRLDHGGIALAPALTVLVLAPELYLPVRNAAAQFHASADGMAAAERVFAELDARPQRAVGAPGPASPGERTGAAAGRELHLSRPQRTRTCRRRRDLRPRASAWPSSARSGAGKTTLARLLLRFDRPQSGRLLHGDIDAATAWTSTCGGNAWRGCPSARTCRRRPSRTRSASAAPTRATPRSRRRPQAPPPTASSATFRRGTRPGGRRGRGSLRRADAARRAGAGTAARRVDAAARRADDEPRPRHGRADRGRTCAHPARPHARPITHDKALAARVADRIVRLEGGRVLAAELLGEPA